MAPRTPYKLQGPQPQRFTVADGQLGLVASASAPTLFRLGTGLFNHGEHLIRLLASVHVNTS